MSISFGNFTRLVYVVAIGLVLGGTVGAGGGWLYTIGYTPTATISVACRLSSSPRAGGSVKMTYYINSSDATAVGLGAGLYDQFGIDHSNGIGDINSIEIAKGHSLITRPVFLPAGIPRGRYELDAEVWPANDVGHNGSNTLADATCAFLNAP